MREPLKLEDIWDRQKDYNYLVREQQRQTSSEWMINYILGTMTELTELLDETNWRTHRVKRVDQFGPNVAEELADITKYVFSMWQIMGYDEQDMLQAMDNKGKLLQQLLMQEMRPAVKGQKVLMLDLDGVVADFRKGFLDWVATTKWQHVLEINQEQIGLHLDLNNSWSYSAYNEAKVEFEQDGGYRRLPAMLKTAEAVATLYRVGWHVIVYTARPYTTYKRIWGDTWEWLKMCKIPVHELHFGYESRVVAASALLEDNFVVAIEDDPTLIRRYEGCKIPVFIYPQPYNESIYLGKDTYLLDPTEESWKISSAIDQLTRKKIEDAIRGETDAQS